MKLEDIAKKAGVSRSTVSRVINDDRYVSERTRKRVWEVIRQNGFEPNPAARTLVTRRSQIVGVAVPQTTNVFFGDNSYYPMLLQGVGETINQRDYAMLLWLNTSNEERQTFAKRVARNRQPDGFVITSVVEDDPLFNKLAESKRLFVMVETPPARQEQINFVSIDNIRAAEVTVEYLIGLGRRRIATITGQLNIRDGLDRFAGYKNAIQKAGLPLDSRLIFEGLFSREAGYRGMKQLLTHRPDAVVCGGDTAGVGAIEAIHEAGLRVPDDIAVVGFDDLDVAFHSYPPLTTIRHSVQRVGAVAAGLLIDLVEGKLHSPQHIILPTELIIRESTEPTSTGRTIPVV